jgi:hypothetical protein
MRGAIHELPNTPSWRGAQLKKSTVTNLPSTFNLLENAHLEDQQGDGKVKD